MKPINFAILLLPSFFPLRQNASEMHVEERHPREVLEVEIRTMQTEMSDQFRQVVERGQRRMQVINYILAVLLIIVLVWAFYASWRQSLQEKISSIDLVPGSVRVVGPTDLCPGDTLTIRYALKIVGVGVVISDDSVKYGDRTVKFSNSRRDIIDQTETRNYEDKWTIPEQPDMEIDGHPGWMPGTYVRYISIAASNIYVSRYTDPVRFTTQFTVKPDCPKE